MEVRHIPAEGDGPAQLHFSHKPTAECPCEPTVRKVYKNQTSGRGGSHQGRKLVRIDITHNKIL